MEFKDFINSFFSVFVLFSFIVAIYCKLSRDSFKRYINSDNVLFLIFLTMLSIINSVYNFSITRCLISLLIWILLALMVFKEDIRESLFKILLCYSLYISLEFIFSIVAFNLPFDNVMDYFQNKWVVTLFTLVIISTEYLVVYLLLKIKKVYTFINTRNKLNYILIYVFLLFILLIQYKNIISFNNGGYYLNVILYSVIILTFATIFIQTKKMKDFNTKNESFLEFLKIYEKQAEIDSEFKHEIMNYLIIMKTMKKRKDIDVIIEEVITKYGKNSTKKYKNISKLPSGLKGIVYYKVFELESLKAKVDLNISPKIDKFFNSKRVIDYKNVSEIMTILLDNAIDAIKKISDKEVSIWLYTEKNRMYIEISNTIEKKVDIKKINEMGYSTKGKNRGLGLYIVNKIIKENKNFELQQSVDNQRFYSTLIIR